MDNLELYEAFREAPKNAIKSIQAGRLKGKSDINPMWRIKALTEKFGACGIGWKYEITKMWLEPGANGEVSGFVTINLYYKYEDQWSEAIPGIGGSSFVANEKQGKYTSDEVYKMALTDALSVACKALGVAADVYWDADRTKYTVQTEQVQQPQAQQAKNKPIFPHEQLNSQPLMEWILKHEKAASQEKKRFSMANLINSRWLASAEDISVLSDNYAQFKINNNI